MKLKTALELEQKIKECAREVKITLTGENISAIKLVSDYYKHMRTTHKALLDIAEAAANNGLKTEELKQALKAFDEI